MAVPGVLLMRREAIQQWPIQRAIFESAQFSDIRRILSAATSWIFLKRPRIMSPRRCRAMKLATSGSPGPPAPIDHPRHNFKA